MLYEMRQYTVNPGKMPVLLARFRDHTQHFFDKHGIQNVAYWTNTVGGRNDELIYVLGYRDMGHREEAWNAFQADPEWQRIRSETEAKDGPIVHHIENRFLAPTDFSPLD